MKLAAESKTINELLSRNIFYEVPRNQRKFVWEEEQLTQLYEDVFENNDGEYHFMGCLVLEQSSKSNEDYYKIIDGQQRLTTFNILLLVITKIFYELDDVKKANSNIKFIIGDIDGEEQNKIVVDDSYITDMISSTFDNITVEKMIEKLKYNGITCDKYNKKVLSSFMFYYKKITSNIEKFSKTEKIKKVADFKNKLLSVNIIEIKVPYDDNGTMGYKIFEVLNARGIPLEQHELIKNYIFKYIKTKKGKKVDKAKKQWDSIVNNLVKDSTDNMNNFFSHYVIHKYGIKPTNKKGEFDLIKNKCEKKEINELLEDLVKKSKYYSIICNPEELEKVSFFDPKIFISLEFFKDMNIRQIRPLLMSLFNCFEKGFISSQVLIDMISYLESFYFMYVIVCKNKTNYLEATVNSFAFKIENEFSSETLEKMLESFKKFKVSYDNYLSNFNDIGYSSKNKKYKNSANKKTVYYIMKKIEDYYDEDEEQTLEKFSIEHIMCDSEVENMTSMLGNLLPLSGKRNNKLSDSNFSIKYKTYCKSNIITVKKFITNYHDIEVWDENCIKERTKKIAELGFNNIWKI